jgi:hypothetical protein
MWNPQMQKTWIQQINCNQFQTGKNPRQFAVSLRLAHLAVQETTAGRMKASCLPLPAVQMLMPGRLCAYCGGLPFLLFWGLFCSLFLEQILLMSFGFIFFHERD